MRRRWSRGCAVTHQRGRGSRSNVPPARLPDRIPVPSLHAASSSETRCKTQGAQPRSRFRAGGAVLGGAVGKGGAARLVMPNGGN